MRISKTGLYQDFLFLINKRIKKLKWIIEETPEKQGEKIGEMFFFINRDIVCLQHYYNFFKGKENDYKGVKYLSIFNYFIRIFWDRLYLNISKLLDKRKNVLSLKIFFLNYR